jgi:predicted outer membrane repeat protein
MNDNTFSKAQFIGSVSSKGGAIRAQGSISSSDRVDIYRFTVRSGAAFTLRGSVDVESGRCNYTTYSRDASGLLMKNITFQSSRGNDTINLSFLNPIEKRFCISSLINQWAMSITTWSLNLWLLDLV